jgi:hypothetical protein
MQRLFPVVVVIELILRGHLLASVLFLLPAVLIAMNLRREDGSKVFDVQHAKRFGPIYYFPMRVLDDL